MRRSFSALVTVIAVMALLTTSVFAVDRGKDLLQKVQTAGKLVVSTDGGWPPYSQLIDGTYEGFDIDVATKIAERLGVRVVFLPEPWNEITAGSWGGLWDISVGSMAITPARAKVLDFSRPYWYEWSDATKGHPVLARLAAAVDKSGPDDRRFMRLLNKIINDMHADGTLSRLSWKWLGADYSVVSPRPRPGK